MNIPRTGQETYNIGTLVTKTLVIAGDGQITTTSDHPRGAMLRAYDKKTGKEAGAVYMPAPQSGSPMTYMANGKQYIVVAVSGGAYSGNISRLACRDRVTQGTIGMSKFSSCLSGCYFSVASVQACMQMPKSPVREYKRRKLLRRDPCGTGCSPRSRPSAARKCIARNVPRAMATRWWAAVARRH